MPVSGSNGYRSGIVTLPNRVRLREMDSRTGMYPTIARTGDATRGGNLSIPEFDDTQTVIFSKGVDNLLLGSLLKSGSTRSLLPYATPNNPNGGLSGTGNVIAGISDNYYMTDYKELTYKNQEEESNPENLGFFNDSRINLTDTEFFMTGTSENIYPGFSSRLHDKTQVVIDLGSLEVSEFGQVNQLQASTPSSDTTTRSGPYMAYYNKDLKRWETTGYGGFRYPTASTFDAVQESFVSASIGFTQVGALSTGSTNDQTGQTLHSDRILGSYARPTEAFGFPFAMKYHATSSNIIDMSNYITAPFLLEKLQWKIDVRMRTPSESERDAYKPFSNKNHPTTANVGAQSRIVGLRAKHHTFFILRQAPTTPDTIRSSRFKLTGLADERIYYSTASDSLKSTYLDGLLTNVDESVENYRELVTYSQLVSYHTASSGDWIDDNGDSLIQSAFSRDESLIFEVGSSTRHHFTGTFLINSNCKNSPVSPPGSSLGISTNKNAILFSDTGSRLFSQLESGRSVYGGVPATEAPQEERVVVRSGQDYQNLEFFKKDNYEIVSPYILLPEDKLIIGYQHPITPNSDNDDNDTDSAASITHSVTFDGSGQLTLFGSSIKENKEFHDTLNQPLTSEAIHEAIHYDNPVVDRYTIASRVEFSGSYVDLHRDSESSLSADNDLTTESIVSSGNSLPNSMQRFVRLVDSEKVFYDTLVPDPIKLWQLLTGQSVALQTNGLKALGIGGGNHANSGSHGVSKDWLRSFAYNNKLERVDINAQETNLKDTIIYFADGDTSGETYANGNGDQYIERYKGFNFNGTSVLSGIASTNSNDFSKIVRNNLMWLYGYGSGISGSLKGVNITTPSSFRYQVTQRPRGYKYGVFSVEPIGRSNIFRYDNFGQPADMLEQSYDSIFYSLNQKDFGEGPVKINFVAKEEVGVYKILDKDAVSANTNNSSNISVFATSSLPYFDDDTVRNRTYPSGEDQTLITVVLDEV